MRVRVICLAVTLSLSFLPAYSATPPKAGSACSKQGIARTYQGKKFTCIKSGKKLVWNKGVIVKIPTPIPSLTPSPTPIASSIPTFTPNSTPNITPEPTPVQPAFTLTDLSKYQGAKSCQISSTLSTSEHLGFPRPPGVVPSIGNVRAITLFVYFDDLPFEQKQIEEWKNNQIPTFERFAKSMSYGKLNFVVDTFDKALHINKSVLSYNLDTAHGAPQKPNADVLGLIKDAISVADPIVDFSPYSFVNVVTASTNKIGFEGAYGGSTSIASADGVQFKRATFGPIREYVDDPLKKIWLLHEVGHLWGLIHPFNVDGNSWGRAGYPKFSAMASGISRAPDFLAWERFVLNWFSDNQVACISIPTESEFTIKLTDISSNSSGFKMLAIKLSNNEAVVLESRKQSDDSWINKEEEGIFAYIIDANIGGNVGAANVIYKESKPASGWFPSTLAKGDTARFRKYTFEILESDSSGEIVKIKINE